MSTSPCPITAGSSPEAALRTEGPKIPRNQFPRMNPLGIWDLVAWFLRFAGVALQTVARPAGFEPATHCGTKGRITKNQGTNSQRLFLELSHNGGKDLG